MTIETQKDMRRLAALQKMAQSWGGSVGSKAFNEGVAFANASDLHKRGIAKLNAKRA
jgi:hypothetical protein